jgi:hypothetical protein
MWIKGCASGAGKVAVRRRSTSGRIRPAIIASWRSSIVEEEDTCKAMNGCRLISETFSRQQTIAVQATNVYVQMGRPSEKNLIYLTICYFPIIAGGLYLHSLVITLRRYMHLFANSSQ